MFVTFLQDGCPVQNSKKARQAVLNLIAPTVSNTVGAIKFSTSPHSPGFNHKENIFNCVKCELRAQTYEKYKL